MYQPLADELRPTTLDDVYGQEEILGEGRMLRRMIESGRVPNLIFYGPSGTGKTTVANIIAAATQRTLYKLNATTASTADIREIVSQLDTFMAPNGVLLYLDEIQSFNKSSSSPCSSTSKTARSRSSPPRRRTRISISSTPSSAAVRSSSSSPSRPRPPRRPSAAPCAIWQKGAARGHGGAGRARAHRKLLRRRYPQGAQCRRGPVSRRQDRRHEPAYPSRGCEGRHAALGHAL